MNLQKLRRSGRVSKTVPILLIGNDYEGRVFTEDTRTVMLSFHGAGIVSGHKLVAEQELVLRSTESQRETEIRVVGEIGSQGNLHTYGVAFLDETLDFWGMEFPAPPSLEERPLELVLECSGCNSTATLLNGDYEFDVCAIHGGLVRHCAECGFATVWKRAEPGKVPRAAPAKVERETAEQRRVTASARATEMKPELRRKAGRSNWWSDSRSKCWIALERGSKRKRRSATRRLPGRRHRERREQRRGLGRRRWRTGGSGRGRR